MWLYWPSGCRGLRMRKEACGNPSLLADMEWMIMAGTVLGTFLPLIP